MQRINVENTWEFLVPKILMFAGIMIITLAAFADSLGIGGIPGFGPNQITLALSGFAVLISGMVRNSSVNYRYIGEWLLVIAGVIAAGLAADLLVIGGLPGFGFKQVMLGSVLLAVLVTAVLPATLSDRRGFRDWVKYLTFEREKIAKFLVVSVQLALLVLVIRQFELENQAFYNNVMLLTLYGFVIHFFLPKRYRLPYFLLLSLVAIGGILGLQNGVWLVGLGLVLIGISHLPLSLFVRVFLLLIVGGSIAALRTEAFTTPIPGAIWPILGSMFMFRLIIYIYDLSHQKGPVNFWQTLSYFFLLPNVVFPFFPVVDFATFRRTYYDNKDRFRIYQTGVEWIFRGVLQLIFYRFINYYVVIAPEDVNNVNELVRFAASNFLLYVRVSGQFHIIVGLLHLFGFNLPETHHQYFLSAGFTDLWRRINIYWKDFMLKIIYNPTYFKLRKFGTLTGILLTTVVVFVFTWFFHAYQWFWLRGTFPLTSQDIFFWTMLAVLLIANTLIELKRGRQRTLSDHKFSWRDLISMSVRTAGTFALMCVLWSLWTGNSIADWVALWSVGASFLGVANLLLAFIGFVVVFGLAILLGKASQIFKGSEGMKSSFFKPAMFNGLLILAVFIIGSPTISTRLGDRAHGLIEDLRVSRLSDRDAELLRRGYYEDLMGVNRFNPDLWEIYNKRPTDWPLLQDTELAQLTRDFRVIEINPSKSIIYHNERFSTNEWGFRDKSYDKIPPANTFRVALVGPSFVMGSGVADEQTFEWLLEDRLNSQVNESSYSGYEILNFGTAGHSALQELYTLENTALDFKPNAVFYVAHQLEEDVVVRNLGGSIRDNAEIPYEFLNSIIQREGLTSDMSQEELERLLKPYGPEIIAWTYQRIAEVCAENGIIPVWIYIPALELPSSTEYRAELMQVAEQAGLVTINLEDVYSGQNADELIVAEWDKHPNAKGHQLIAKALYDALLERSDLIPLGLTPGNSTP